MHVCRSLALIAVLLSLNMVASGAGFSYHPAPLAPDTGHLQLALRKLGVLGSALYIGAHPDDENTALLAYLAHGRLIRTGYLAMTRGDGGQNLIGPETGILLGVIRTYELLAARQIDGAEQYFTRALDFGYSKSAQETLDLWGHDAILSDVVRILRQFRPDILITRFPPTGRSGHGHHAASARLALEAFHAAGDPQRFPEQLRDLEPWQPRRIFWNVFRFGRRAGEPPDSAWLRLDLGQYNPLLGRSYAEIAAFSRSMHKSQGFGSAPRPGSVPNYFALLGGEPARSDLFEGIDLSWSRVPGGQTVGRLLTEAAHTFDPDHPAASIPLLLRALTAMRALPPLPWVRIKERELLEVLRGCAGLWLEARSDRASAAPGESVTVTLRVVNRARAPVRLVAVQHPQVANTEPIDRVLPYNELVEIRVDLRIPSDHAYTIPYWLRRPHRAGRFQVPTASLIGRAVDDPPLQMIFVLRFDGTPVAYRVPVQYVWTDPVAGEQRRPLEVVPPLTGNFSETLRVFPDSRPRRIQLHLRRYRKDTQATVSFHVKPAWQVSPAAGPATSAKTTAPVLDLVITPPQQTDTAWLKAVVHNERDEPLYSETLLQYPHIPYQTLLLPARVKLVRVPLTRPPRRIGYIMGSGDAIPRFLEQLDYAVTLLSDEDLETRDLNRDYDVIIAGIRAYNTRPRLASLRDRLMAFVKNGGTYIVQYNTTRGLVTNQIGPYPFRIGRDRVAVETAPVSLSPPDHPVLTRPHRITQADFDHWVQERGLYFATEWDPRYETPLASHDPGEPPHRGGLLYARYGKGVFIYTAFSWFRQLPAGVPGAFRLFVNLVSARGENGS